ncbi:MAG: DUF2087 domain-containing protein [Nocardioidaceae bacterium]
MLGRHVVRRLNSGAGRPETRPDHRKSHRYLQDGAFHAGNVYLWSSRGLDLGIYGPTEEAALTAPCRWALRRALVDEGFLTRENNVYWRTGGTVDV